MNELIVAPFLKKSGVFYCGAANRAVFYTDRHKTP